MIRGRPYSRTKCPEKKLPDMTATVPVEFPEVGQAVHVRNRLATVRAVEPYDTLGQQGRLHIVEVEYLADCRYPEASSAAKKRSNNTSLERWVVVVLRWMVKKIQPPTTNHRPPVRTTSSATPSPPTCLATNSAPKRNGDGDRCLHL